MPRQTDRQPRRWPKLFTQEFSRAQDGANQDASFLVGFELSRQEPGGKPCIEIKLKLQAALTAKHRYFRDRFAHLKLRATGPEIPGRGEPASLRRKEAPQKKEPAARAKPIAWGLVPVYIAVGKQDVEGDLVVGCVSKAGEYSGTVEISAFAGGPERMLIPWRLKFENGDVPTISYGMGEQAVPDPDAWMGRELHPRRRLEPGEKLRNVPYRFTGSSSYPDRSEAPDGYLERAYPVEDEKDRGEI